MAGVDCWRQRERLPGDVAVGIVRANAQDEIQIHGAALRVLDGRRRVDPNHRLVHRVQVFARHKVYLVCVRVIVRVRFGTFISQPPTFHGKVCPHT